MTRTDRRSRPTRAPVHSTFAIVQPCTWAYFNASRMCLFGWLSTSVPSRLVMLLTRLYHCGSYRLSRLLSILLTAMEQSDLIIIGGGIVGLATAYRFLGTISRQDASPCWKRKQRGRQASDGPKLGRAALGDLLSARVAQGRELPRRQIGDGRVLPRARRFRSICAAR